MRLPIHRPNHPPTRRVVLVAAALMAVSVLVACGQQSDDALGPAALPSAPAEAQLDVSALLHVLTNAAEPGAVARHLSTLPPVEPALEVDVRNLHDPRQIDTIRTLRFPGVELEVYHVSATKAKLLKSVRVERSDVQFHGLRVGMPAAAARSAVGPATPPYFEDADTYWLALDGAAPAQVSLHIAADELTAFTVHGYLD